MKRIERQLGMWVLGLLAGTLALSCEQDAIRPLQGGQGELSVQLRLRTPRFEVVETKAGQELAEDAVQDLLVLQFVDGTLVNKIVYQGKEAAFFEAPILLPFQDVSPMGSAEGNAMVLFANYYANGFDQGDVLMTVAQAQASGGTATTWAEFETKSYAYDLDGVKAPNSGASTRKYVPMVAQYYGAIGNGVTVINAALRRLVAKVNFTLRTDEFKTLVVKHGAVAYERPQVRVKRIELHNVPRTVTPVEEQGPATFMTRVDDYLSAGTAPEPAAAGRYLLPEGGNEANTYGWYSYPAEKGRADFYTNYPTPWKEDATATVNGPAAAATEAGYGTYTVTGYLPEHAFYGNYSTFITEPAAKKPASVLVGWEDGFASSAPVGVSPDPVNDDNSFFTHFFVEIEYYRLEDSTPLTACYNIYLGENNTADMSLLRNHQYNIEASLKGADVVDVRINSTASENPRTGLEIQEEANCYMINPASLHQYGEGEDQMKFVIPLHTAEAAWQYVEDIEAAAHIDYAALEDLLNGADGKQWKIITEWRTWGGHHPAGDEDPNYYNVTGRPLNAAEATALRAALGNEVDPKRYAVLSFPACLMESATFAEGGHNAIIALVYDDPAIVDDDLKTIYWSWHLWLTDYQPARYPQDTRGGAVHQYAGPAFSAGGMYHNYYIMDRNLGATVMRVPHRGSVPLPQTNEEAVKTFGLYFQHSRKDPFMGPRAEAVDGLSGASARIPIFDHQGTWKNFETLNAMVVGDYTHSIHNPTVLAKPVSNYWTPAAYATIDLWQSDATQPKSVFDPCPYGWRVPAGDLAVPKKNAFIGLGEAQAVPEVGGQSLTDGRKYHINGNPDEWAWAPFSGYRDASSGSFMYFNWNIAGVWTSSLESVDNNRVYAYFDGYFVMMAQSGNASLYPLRCIQDPTATRPVHPTGTYY